jgi:DNA-binding IclR family transcriptional regulator
LTQTLVVSGYLQVEPRKRTYGLAPAVLSLAHAMRSGSTILSIAAPRMRATSQAERITVGLAAADRDEMVYLESIRYNREASLRSIVSGQRVPMELTSLGRAYLARTPESRRKALFTHFRQRRGSQWVDLELALDTAIRAVHEQGYCAASWQPEVVAVAAPLIFKGLQYALNVSLPTAEPFACVVRSLAPTLLALKTRIQRELDAATDD